jgi:hypothetical protein
MWAALAAGDASSLALLSSVPIDVPAKSSAKGDPYKLDTMRALIAFVTGRPEAETLLLEALKGTDPATPHIAPDDMILDIDVPAMEVFFALLDGESAAFDAAIEKATLLHKRYWTRPARADDPDGLLALPLTALAHLGRQRGLRFSFRSSYLPEPVITWQSTDTLVLCPYCMTPIVPGAERCPACLEDPRNDAPFESDFPDFATAAREPCRACQFPMIRLAVRCPRCRTRQ